MLTNREKEVVKYVVLGLSNKEIARVLFISSHTVKAHVSMISQKLHAKNRTHLAYIIGKMEALEDNIF